MNTAERDKNKRTKWKAVIARAAEIVKSYDTLVTLRQLFYRLVAAALIPNKETAYKQLSSLTASARREGTFPDLIDLTRQIHRHTVFTDPADAHHVILNAYREDRTAGQAASLYLGVEKRGMVAQLDAWFSHLGIPILALSGYASQSFVDEVRRDSERQGRPAVLLYAGDLDASGEDIDRDFIARTHCFDEIERIALTLEQVKEHDLPPQPGKASDTRAHTFTAKYGQNIQVELDALPPDVLRALFQAAIDARWDMAAYEAALEKEERARRTIQDWRA